MFDLPCDYRDAVCPDQWIPRDGWFYEATHWQTSVQLWASDASHASNSPWMNSSTCPDNENYPSLSYVPEIDAKIGFNWGSSGVSMNVWKVQCLVDLLKRGISSNIHRVMLWYEWFDESNTAGSCGSDQSNVVVAVKRIEYMDRGTRN